MHVTFRQLRFFEAVARHQSVTRAATELHVTQPAVSMTLRELEDQIGVPLLDRQGRKLHLTEAGRELLHHARRADGLIQDIAASMNQLRGLERGVLRLAVVSTANYFLSGVLAGYSKQFPGVRVSLSVANRDAVLAALAENAAELAVTGQPPDGGEVVAQHFLDNPLVVIAAPEHPLAGAGTIALERLEGEVLVVREQGSGTRAAMERHFAQHGLRVRTGCELASNEAVKQAVQAGIGLGVVSAQTLELELETRRLVVLPVAGFPILRRWYVVHRSERRLSPAAAALRSMLLAGDPAGRSSRPRVRR
ncbi:MAG: LysR family transcriptional regulator [Burkholderiales bacterium]|nr:LysR family transcriptional regulator [Burkholderiales bacterium]